MKKSAQDILFLALNGWLDTHTWLKGLVEGFNNAPNVAAGGVKTKPSLSSGYKEIYIYVSHIYMYITAF